MTEPKLLYVGHLHLSQEMSWALSQALLALELQCPYHEAFEGPVEGVQEEAGQGADLGRAVPAVGAVHQHAGPLLLHSLQGHSKSSGKCCPSPAPPQNPGELVLISPLACRNAPVHREKPQLEHSAAAGW